MDVGIFSTQAILILSFNIFKVLCRKYGIYLIFGAIIVLIQGFSGYYLLHYGIDSADGNDPIQAQLKDRPNTIERRSNVGYDTLDRSSIVKIPNKSHIGKDGQTHLNSVNRIEDGINRSIGQNDDFGFVLPCEITNKEVLSALQRAKTLECREQIANISCEVQKGTFYPSRLMSSCPGSGHIRGKVVGCFKDNTNNRLLGDYKVVLKKNSPILCADICLQRGFVYSGVEYAKECFCGNDVLPTKSRVPDTECDMKCSGTLKADLTCGGLFRISISETGLAKGAPRPLRRAAEASSPLVRVAYILTVNGRSLRQVLRLFKALFHKDHYFFIHVDSRQHYLFKELLKLESTFSNVVLSRKRFSSIWGGSSLLKVLLHSTKELLLKSDWNWDFVINLSESDYPIKTNSGLVSFLTANRDRNFLKSHGHDTNKFLQKQGLDRTFFQCENHMWRIGERKLPLGIRIDGGSDWIGLNRVFVEYLTFSSDLLVDGLKKVFFHTLLPGESFFHTVLRNSEYCQSFTDNNLHVTNWKRKLGCRCQYKHIVDWCGCSPNDFTLHDWDKLEASSNKNLFFGRKFEAVKSLEAINKVDEWLYGSYDSSTPNLMSFWDSLFHYEDPPSGKDDVSLTLFHSTARLTASLLKTFQNEGKKGGECDVTPVIPLQAHSYHVDDQFKGILVEVLTRTKAGVSLKFETLLQPKNRFERISKSPFAHKIDKVEVNTNFDLKEQMFRNFGGHLGPESEISVAIWLRPQQEEEPHVEVLVEEGQKEVEEEEQICIILVDSLEAVAAGASVKLEKEETVLSHTFTLTMPLRPGAWTAILVHGQEVLVMVSFPVLPMQFVQGRQVSVAEGRTLHSGPQKPYSDDGDRYSQLLTDNEHLPRPPSEYPGRDDLVKAADKKAFVFGPQLSKWIDEVVDEFYFIDGVCHLKTEALPPCFQDTVPLCSDTLWSSYSPDPKAELGKIDPGTGRLEDPFRMPRSS